MMIYADGSIKHFNLQRIILPLKRDQMIRYLCQTFEHIF
jgi:hypothetical protein